MTIHFNADFTRRLQKRFDEYTELKRGLELWGLSIGVSINKINLPAIESVGILRKRMEHCKKNRQCAFDWDIGPSDRELASCICLLEKVAKDMDYDGLGIVSIDYN
jgi:hypothetical protein